MIELRVLGPPRIDAPSGRGVTSVVRQPRRLALLAYLAAATPRGSQRRDKLLAVFWPEADDSRARASLNQALYVLRSALGDEVFTSSPDEVGLDFGGLWCDVAEFEEALDASRAEEALALYRGDLLDGFHIAEAPAFEHWVDEERMRLRQRASEGAWTLAEARAAEGNVAEAERWARRAASLAPENEAVVRRLMIFLRGLGDRASAIRAYEAFAWRLAEEYALEPSAETSALASAIRDEERRVPLPVLADIQPSSVSVPPRRAPLSRRWMRAASAFGVVGAVAAVAVWAPRQDAPTSAALPGTWVSLLDVDDAPPLAEGLAGTTIALSKDRHIAYVGRGAAGRQLFLKRSDRVQVTPIANTQNALQPFFSPDGEWIGYVVDNAIRKVRLSGRRSLEIYRGPTAVQGASWGDDDAIVFALDDGLHRVSASGGPPTPVALSDSSGEEWYRWPDVLPGSRAALFTLVSDSAFELAAVSLESGRVHRLGVLGASPLFLEPELLVWTHHNGALLGAPFDSESVRLTGPPRPLVEDVHVGMSGDAKLGAASGALAYVPVRAGNALVLVDTLGNEDSPVSLVGFEEPKFTADGRRIVAAHRYPDSRLADIVTIDLLTRDVRRITHDSGSFGPIVSPTFPHRVAVASKPGGRPYGFGVRTLWIDSTAPAEVVLAPEPRQRPRDFTPDGRALVFQRHDAETLFDIWFTSLDGEGEPTAYLRGRASERGAAISPNGQLLAYVSDESGRDEVYVGEFPEMGHAVQMSHAGGTDPRWARSGDALFYRSDAGMTRVEILGDSPLMPGPRKVLFDDRPYMAAYDVHPDGSRFVMLRRTEDRGDLLLWLGSLDGRR